MSVSQRSPLSRCHRSGFWVSRPFFTKQPTATELVVGGSWVAGRLEGWLTREAESGHAEKITRRRAESKRASGKRTERTRRVSERARARVRERESEREARRLGVACDDGGIKRCESTSHTLPCHAEVDQGTPRLASPRLASPRLASPRFFSFLLVLSYLICCLVIYRLPFI